MVSKHGTQALPPSKQQLAQCLIEDGVDVQSIAEEVDCCRRTVFNYKRNLKQHGSCLAPSISRMGRPPKVTDEIIKVQYTPWVKLAFHSLSRVELKSWVGFETVFERKALSIPG